MTAKAGRLFVLKKDGTIWAGLQENDLSEDTGAVEITSKDDSGNQTYGDFVGMRAGTMNASGIWKDDTFRAIAMAGTDSSKLLTDVTLEYADGATRTGNVVMTNYTATGAHDGAEIFSCTLQTSGAQTYTAAV